MAVRPLFGTGVLVAAVAVLAPGADGQAQPAGLPFQPKAAAPPRKISWPPGGWEGWTGSVSTPAKPGVSLERPGDLPQYEFDAARNAWGFKTPKHESWVTLLIKREKGGAFTGWITYPGLRTFELKVSGRIDGRGRATFTEEIDPKHVPYFHPWPRTFAGTIDGNTWEGEVVGGASTFKLTADRTTDFPGYSSPSGPARHVPRR
jgi:hypothetical protein